MDTRSKVYNKWLKLTAFIAVVVIATLMVWQYSSVSSRTYGSWYYGWDGVFSDNFEQTEYHKNDLRSLAYNLNLIERYKSEEEIKTGRFVERSVSYYQELQDLYANSFNQIRNELVSEKYPVHVPDHYRDENWDQDWIDDYASNYITQQMIQERFEEKYAGRIEQIKKRNIESQLSSFKHSLEALNERPEIVYYIIDEQNPISNSNLGMSDIQKTYGRSYTNVDWNIWSYGYDHGYNWYDSVSRPSYPYRAYDHAFSTPYYDQDYNYGYSDEVYIFDDIYHEPEEVYVTEEYYNTPRWVVAFTNEYIAARNTEFDRYNRGMTSFLVFAAAGGLFLILCLVYLVFAAGKKASAAGSVTMLPIDRLWNEITAGLAILICPLYIILGQGFYWTVWQMAGDYTINLRLAAAQKYFFITAIAITTAVLLALLLMLVRHIKNKTLFKNTVIFSVFHRIGRVLVTVYSSANPMLKTMLLLTLLGIITMIPAMGFVTIPIAIWIVYGQVKGYVRLKEGVAVIKTGVYDKKIEIDGRSEFALLAGDINDIALGLGEEVERRIKSERLKTELIVNVSHDIKTPLTSLITYADLLKKEETDNENIIKYVDVISKKSDRLKLLIEDLFESAKASSGNIKVNFEKVEINSLITQGLAEIEDKIKASTLEFKVNIPEKLYAYADGQLLWRVLDNLLSNTLKYSLDKSRVYIDAQKSDNDIYIEIKNISAMPLGIPEDEITERFKRGDLSRSSEGSGLGLDIAKSLMLCQNGDLDIKIDGDLFKARVRVGGSANI
ncbi:MAG: HAMP domain-containing histidine kinase [Oscillospiraceae bacterium]|nr:HAMP domain-containing histidine kinase [Oscillospiraceae bacterium]